MEKPVETNETADADPQTTDASIETTGSPTTVDLPDAPVESVDPESQTIDLRPATHQMTDESADDAGAPDDGGDTDPTDRPTATLADLLAGLGLLPARPAPTAPAGTTLLNPSALLAPAKPVGPITPPRLADLRTPDGQLLDPERYAHLLCDPIFRPLLIDGRGTPLALGRSARHATPGQRRALTVRDGGCVFPGCERPPGWCDAHHITEWDHGGLTDLHILALLCRRHHRITHRRGWTMGVEPHGTFTWTTPTGRTLHSTPHLPWTHTHAA